MTLAERLTRPVPPLDHLRQQKLGYRSLSIDTTHSLHAEPLVDIAAHAIAGQSYYSRPNALFSIPLDDVPQEVYVRRSIAETLQRLNRHLAVSAITEFFQGEVELYIEEGVRSSAVQQNLYHSAIPERLRQLHPDWSERQIGQRRDEIIALPTVDTNHPAPHASGGAIDITLRYAQPSPLFVPGVEVPMGHSDGDTTERINPDYFEYTKPDSEQDKLAQRNRRALYNIMTGYAFGMSSGLTVNPTEFWHWDRGNSLWSVTSGEAPYYGVVLL